MISKIYLISNFRSSKLNKLILNDSDLVILFNHAYPIIFDNIKYHPNKWLFLRAVDTKYGYWGADQLIQNTNISYQKLIFINDKPEMISLICRNIYKNYDVIRCWQYISESGYNTEKSMTSGFVAFWYLSHLFNVSKIELINFTGCGSDGSEGWSKHDYLFEQNYYKKYNIKQKII